MIGKIKAVKLDRKDNLILKIEIDRNNRPLFVNLCDSLIPSLKKIPYIEISFIQPSSPFYQDNIKKQREKPETFHYVCPHGEDMDKYAPEPILLMCEICKKNNSVSNPEKEEQ